MLLHASNFSLCLYGQEIDRLAIAMCKINGALYAPWISFPLPPSIIGARSDDPSGTAIPSAARVSDGTDVDHPYAKHGLLFPP